LKLRTRHPRHWRNAKEVRKWPGGKRWIAPAIAVKTEFKFARTNEARFFVTIALACFALAVVLASNAFAELGQLGGTVEWSIRPRLLAAAVLGLFTAAAAYDWYRLDQTVDNALDPRRAALLSDLKLLPFSTTLYVFAVVIPVYGSWRVLASCLLIVSLITSSLAVRRRFPAPRDRTTRVVSLMSVLVVGFLPLALLWADLTAYLLPFALVPLVCCELPRLLKASLTWRTRRP
jgi:hypothetical protein